MKKLLSLVFALVLVVGVFSANAESPKLESILKSGKLVCATDAAWAPFEYVGENGAVTGCDLEIAAYIAQQLGVELEIVNVAFDTLPTYLANDEADVVLAAMTITEERAESVDFSIPYTTACQYIIVAEDDDSVSTIEDLAGKAIGVHLGTTGDFLVSDEIMLPEGVLYETGAVVQQYHFLTDACLALKNYELQAIVCDTQLAMNLCASNSGLKCFELVYADGSKTDEQYGVAMKKGDAEFVAKVNEILAPIVEDGTIDGWIVKHSELSSNLK